MEIVLIVRHQNTTLVNDLKESLVVEGFMEVGVGVDLHISRPDMVVAKLKKSDMRNRESISSYSGNLGEFVDLYFKSAPSAQRTALISAFSTPALTLGP